MLKYLEFISESVAKISLPYYYSNRFRDLLKNISKKGGSASKVTDFLLSCENIEGVTDDITFVDMTDKNDMVSFIQVNRVKRIYDKDKVGDESWKDFVNWLWEDELSDVWTKQRTQIGVGRFITRISGKSSIGIKDSEREDFVNVYKSTFDLIRSGESNFELVTGEKIKHWYLVDNYEIQRGQLGNSCMRYARCQSYFDIYTKNPNQVSLLILKSENDSSKIVGRALVWKLTSGEYLMDRVYSIEDYDVNLFLDYSKKRNWRDKENMTYSEMNKIEVKLDRCRFDDYPYMDTFCCLNCETGILSPNEDKWPEKGWWKLRDTNGGYDGDNMVWSNYHDEYISRDDATFCENDNDWVTSDNAIYLEYKDIYASPNEEVIHCNYNSSTYYLDDTVYSGYMDDNIYREDAIEIVVNSHRETDWIVDDLNSSIMEMELDGDTVQTLPVFVIEDPSNGFYYFKDSKIEGKSIIDHIISSSETVSHEELEKYILESDFDISDWDRLYKALTISRFNGGREDMSDLRYYDLQELSNMVKCMLIISPDKSNRRSDNNPIVINWVNFKRNLIEPDKNRKLIDMLVSDKLKQTLLGVWHSDFSYKCVIFSDGFANVILRDPKMLATWYKWKMN